MSKRVAKREFRGLVSILGSLITALVLLAAGCTAETDQQGGSGESGAGSGAIAGGGSGAGGAGGADKKVGAECMVPNQTEACKCVKDGKTFDGARTCNSRLAWGICDCWNPDGGWVYDASVPTWDANVSDAYKAATFDWFQTTPQGSCKAGYYTGAFDGQYGAQAMVQFTFGFWSTITLNGDVQATFMEKPGSNGEFFQIADGKFLGTAISMFPFVGDFVGELECSTRTFKGKLIKCYYEMGGDKYGFQGIANAQYDTVQHSFVNGVWSVTEPDGESMVYSAITAVSVDYSTLTFPDPVPVSPGTPLPTPFPPFLGFKGGYGNWNLTWTADKAP